MHEDRMQLELAIRGFILSNFYYLYKDMCNFTICTKICAFP